MFLSQYAQNGIHLSLHFVHSKGMKIYVENLYRTNRN